MEVIMALSFSAIVHLSYLLIGTIRHMYDTRTYTAIYTSLVTNSWAAGIIKLRCQNSAPIQHWREFVDFRTRPELYVIEAGHNIFGSLVILFFYDKTVVGICVDLNSCCYHQCCMAKGWSGWTNTKTMSWKNRLILFLPATIPRSVSSLW